MTRPWRWALALGAAVLMGALSMGYVLTRPAGWRVESVVAFAPKSTNAGGDLLQLTADKYVAYMGSPALQRQISPRAADGDSVRVARDSETANVRVTVTGPKAADAAAFANALARAATQKAGGEPIVNADVIAPADAGAADRTPERAPYLLVGGLLALLAGLLTWYATGERRTK